MGLFLKSCVIILASRQSTKSLILRLCGSVFFWSSFDIKLVWSFRSIKLVSRECTINLKLMCHKLIHKIIWHDLGVRSCNISLVSSSWDKNLSSRSCDSSEIMRHDCCLMITWYYLPTPPLGQDMTQGQFLSGV